MTGQRFLSKKRILLTGAAGGIGSAFFRSAAGQYTFRLADVNKTAIGEIASGEHEVVALDVANLEACQHACRNIDVVIHLAANANPDADFNHSLLHHNIQGTYNIFRAAKDQACQRVIFASSAQVFAGYPIDVQAHPESPLRPMNMYGVCKCFGEAVASYFAHAEGLSSIVIRIGSYDVNHLLVRCIEAPHLHFAVVHGISNNRFKRLDITSTRTLVEYTPQDDAFEIFHADLQTWLQG